MQLEKANQTSGSKEIVTRHFEQGNFSAFEIQRAIFEVGSAVTPTDALHAFRRNFSILRDWRIIYASSDNTGTFKLRRQQFSSKGFVSTIFRGQSLWVFDSDAVEGSGYTKFLMGTATFFDSNAASYIESLAYKENPSPQVKTFCLEMSQNFSTEELSNINPFLYLYEAQREKSEKHVSAVRRTVAALHAISLIKRPLNEEWGDLYRTQYRAESEAYADLLLMDFYRRMDYTGDEIERQVDIMEAMLVRTLIIEYSSAKSAMHKLEALMQFMHEEISTLMFRELIVCADFLCREKKSQMSNKLNSLFDRPDPFAAVRNCARDLFLLRTMDEFSNTHADASLGSFYVANLITFDKDLADVLKLAELRAVALHRRSSTTFPIYNEALLPWLSERLGDKRLEGLSDLFSKEGFERRAAKRSRSQIERVLKEDKVRLAELIEKRRSTRMNTSSTDSGRHTSPFRSTTTQR